jgi:hypothetical protein
VGWRRRRQGNRAGWFKVISYRLTCECAAADPARRGTQVRAALARAPAEKTGGGEINSRQGGGMGVFQRIEFRWNGKFGQLGNAKN